MEKNSTVDFKALEKELQASLAADEKYKRENAAKLRAVAQKVPSYEDFRLAPSYFFQASGSNGRVGLDSRYTGGRCSGGRCPGGRCGWLLPRPLPPMISRKHLDLFASVLLCQM